MPRDRAERRYSLVGRLLRSIVLPMAGLALVLGVGGAVVIHNAVQRVNDRILRAASRAIAESLTVEQGEVALDLSPAIFGMMDDNQRDNVYYSVRHQDRTITGYADLPSIAPKGMRDTAVRFGNASYRGMPVRIVAEGRRIPGMGRPVVVEVAETLGARQRVEHRLLAGLVLLELLLIGISILLLPIAVRWGTRPLISLSEEMDRRLAVDLTPLHEESVPIELRQVVVAFNGMLTRLDTTLQRMKQFTADASHQLRTPLSILRAHIAVLRGVEPMAPEAAASIADIDEASDRLQRLIVQLLTLARMEDAALPPESFSTIDANELAASIAAEHAPAAVGRAVELRLERAGHVLPIRTHVLLATELLGNIVDNAIKYNRVGGSVGIAVSQTGDGDRVDILVEDDGPGIPPADRARVLTRFGRLERDTRQSGSGLGLPIAEAIATAIGARLSLETPASGNGLGVRVSFPSIEPVL